MRRTRSTALVRLAAAVAAVVAVVACSGGGDDDSGGRTTSTVDQEAAVLAAYEAGWRAFEQAAADPVDPNHPALAETMTGPALTSVQTALGRMSELGEYIAGPAAELTPRVQDLSDRSAVIEDCVTDASAQYAADGTIVNEPNATPHTYRAEMVEEEGAWKRVELELEGPCET